MTSPVASNSVPRRAATKSKSSAQENVFILIVLAAHSLQLLQIPLGSAGELIGSIGTLVALLVSLLSTKAMLLLLFGINFIPMTGAALAELRIYIIIYFLYVGRLALTPAAFQLVLGNSPASRTVRRWLFAWLGLAVLAGFFYLSTANTPFGVSCAWDFLRGLGTALLACILAVLVFDDIQEDTILPAAFACYVLLGGVYFYFQFYSMIQQSSDVRLGYGTGADPNAIGMIFNMGIGVCMGIALLARSLPLRLTAVAAILPAGVVIVRTQSRAAVLTAAVMLAVALCVNVRNFFAYLKRLVVVGMVVLALSIIVFPLAKDYLMPRIQGTLESFQDSDLREATAGRTDIFYAYWERAAASNFIGSGFDYSPLLNYTNRITVAHNTWLQVLSDFGIVGFAFFIVMVFPAFNLVFREIWMFGATQSPENKKITLVRTGVAIAIAGALLEASTLTAVYDIVFWWCIGCAMAFACRHRNTVFARKRPPAKTIAARP